MPRRNTMKHPKKLCMTDRYDLDYVNLPEYPQYNQIIIKPYKTIYVNLDADFWSDDFYVVRHMADPVMRKILCRVGNEVIA